ncbi:chemotaxis protein CheW [Methylobacterium sp. C25]|uniref:chemotaxis protein CheW n=1 Tax=Methylobacterium sp. C25 TaxID=2721622 RepID=UPI001F47F15D|nr:chemotaxis protein CheW [Methylobacterium sp. C25]MCE4223825.1 chemotaxis protein CheW [Methylobacterium sp. C25]
MNETELYRVLLDERSMALAARGQAGRDVAAQRDYLVCALGNERYGIALGAIATVLPQRLCTVVPGAPAALRGIISHAGIIVSVIDLGVALGGGRDSATGQSGHLLRLRAEGPPVALAVDRVIRLASIEADAITVAPTAGPHPGLGAEAVSGYAPAGSERDGAAGGGFAILDLPRLLRPYLP